ncbi:MAG: TetR/AcrR family transcriptional regulator [Actinobacteria bacterium]|nr:TetR/AcrR family transcriptional regulator [Actinomycetota bacterium]
MPAPPAPHTTSPVDAAGRRLTTRGQKRRAQLMLEGARLFAERGYHPTSVQEIVATLGVGKGVFYWYFSSKEEFFLEILRAAQTDLRRRQQAAIADETDPIRRVELGIEESLRWFREHREMFNLFQFAITQEKFAPVLRQGQQVAVGDVVRHVKEAIVEGRIRDQDPELLAQAIVGVMSHLARTYLYERDESVEAVADGAKAFCLHGLLG